MTEHRRSYGRFFLGVAQNLEACSSRPASASPRKITKQNVKLGEKFGARVAVEAVL